MFYTSILVAWLCLPAALSGAEFRRTGLSVDTVGDVRALSRVRPPPNPFHQTLSTDLRGATLDSLGYLYPPFSSALQPGPARPSSADPAAPGTMAFSPLGQPMDRFGASVCQPKNASLTRTSLTPVWLHR